MSGVSGGRRFTAEEELWILQNSDKDIIETDPETGETKVVNIVAKDGNIRIIHE